MELAPHTAETHVHALPVLYALSHSVVQPDGSWLRVLDQPEFN